MLQKTSVLLLSALDADQHAALVAALAADCEIDVLVMPAEGDLRARFDQKKFDLVLMHQSLSREPMVSLCRTVVSCTKGMTIVELSDDGTIPIVRQRSAATVDTRDLAHAAQLIREHLPVAA